MKSMGSKTWLIPDAFRPTTGVEPYPSHEAICVLNTGDEDATIRVIIYLEGDEPITGFSVFCKARRTVHQRTSAMVSDTQKTIPTDLSYAMLLVSDVPVVIQYSRMDTTQPAMALMTTMGHALD